MLFVVKDRSPMSSFLDTDPLRPLFFPMSEMSLTGCKRKRKQLECGNCAADGAEKYTKKVKMDTFAPNDIKVKMTDEYIVVEGKYENREVEDGVSSHHVLRKLRIPKDIEKDTISCSMGDDGHLVIEASMKVANPPQSKDRVIPIKLTGKPSVTKAEEKKNEAVEESKQKDDETENKGAPAVTLEDVGDDETTCENCSNKENSR